jgi:hypothetical protein
MPTKAPEKTETKPPKLGDVVDKGVLDDGRPFHDIWLAAGKVYRMTRITVPQSDQAWDMALGEDDKINWRQNNRQQVAFAIVTPPTTLDDFDKLAAVELAALNRAFDDLNSLPPADASGNA